MGWRAEQGGPRCSTLDPLCSNPWVKSSLVWCLSAVPGVMAASALRGPCDFSAGRPSRRACPSLFPAQPTPSLSLSCLTRALLLGGVPGPVTSPAPV